MGIPNNIQQANHIRPSGKVLQDLDFPLDLLLLDRLEHFDDALLVGRKVNTLEDLRVSSSFAALLFVDSKVPIATLTHLGVLSASDFPDNLIVVLHAPLDDEVVWDELVHGQSEARLTVVPP